MTRYALLLAILWIWAAPAVARADASCDSTYASDLATQGYRYLDLHRWNDARMAAGQLAVYARNCNDPKVGYPSVVYSAYIGSAALHGLGDDTDAVKALQMGMTVISLLEKEGGYTSLVEAMQPKFTALAREMKP